MQITTLAFNKAARTEFMKDFHTPEARASALETMAKAMRVYDRAAEYYQRHVDRNKTTWTLEHNPPGMGGTQQAESQARQTRLAEAKRKFDRRTERINTIAGAKLEAIRQNQNKQLQNARPAVAKTQATQQARPAGQERPSPAPRSIFNRKAQETPTRAFNRSR